MGIICKRYLQPLRTRMILRLIIQFKIYFFFHERSNILIENFKIILFSIILFVDLCKEIFKFHQTVQFNKSNYIYKKKK